MSDDCAILEPSSIFFFLDLQIEYLMFIELDERVLQHSIIIKFTMHVWAMTNKRLWFHY